MRIAYFDRLGNRARRWLVSVLRESYSAEPERPKTPPFTSGADYRDWRRRQREEATILQWLLLHPEQWVRRRVETFRLVDDRTVARRMSVDFELPRVVEGVEPEGSLTALPLTVLNKEKLTAFDLRDEDGRPLAVLGTSENAEFATRALRLMARRALRGEPGPWTRLLINEVVTSDRDTARFRVADVRRAGAAQLHRDGVLIAFAAVAMQDPSHSAAERLAYRCWHLDELGVLAQDGPFMTLLEELAGGFILLTPHTPEVPRRRIFKLGYETRLPPSVGERWLPIRLGWASSQLRFPIPAATRGASYHVELVAPEDAEVVRSAALAGLGPGAIDVQDGPIARTHLHLREPDPLFPEPAFLVQLRARRQGFLHQAWAICALATLLLLAGRLRLDQVADEVEASAAVLLLVPAILGAAVVRPGEHAHVSSLLVGVRVMVLVSGLCAIAAGAVILGDFRTSTRELVWVWLTLISGVCLLGVSLSNLLPSAPRGQGDG